jgi:hypothetical protein
MPKSVTTRLNALGAGVSDTKHTFIVSDSDYEYCFIFSSQVAQFVDASVQISWRELRFCVPCARLK